MGTDIHMAIEVRRNGRWHWVPNAVSCSDCDGTAVWKDRDGKERECFRCTHRYRGTANGRLHGYSDRNYDAFGIIANVRNGTWGADTPVIAGPRGLPDDISAELKAANDAPYELPDGHENPAHYNLGDHSFTHISLAELLAFNWDGRNGKEATLSAPEYIKWAKRGFPGSYCAWASGETVSMGEADARIAKGETSGFNVRATWGESLADMAGNFHSKFIPELVALAEREGVSPADVRCVFGFDS